MRIVLAAINAKFSHTNLAVRYLAASLREKSLSSTICEYTINQSAREITNDIIRRNPDVILFSCYIWNIEIIQKVGTDLRSLLPNARILLGGPEVSNDCTFQLMRFPFSDGILAGEGENIIADAVLSNVCGQTYRTDTFVDLDSLPFPYCDLDSLSHRVFYYESSRGCPFGCSYCLSSADRHVRYRSLPLVFSDLQTFLNVGAMRVKFVDRTFNLDPKRAYAIWDYLIAHDNGVTGFQMELGGDLLTPEQLALLKTARPGLLQFEIGVQSTYPEALEKACRKTDFSQLADAVCQIQSAENIHCHLDLIAGLPGETFPRFLQSYDEVFALQPKQLQLGFLKLLRGSTLWEQKEKYGLIFSPYPPYEILKTPEITFSELEKLKALEDMTEVYYNSGRFAYSLRYLLQSTSPSYFFLDLAETMPAHQPGKYEYYDILFQYATTHTNCDREHLAWLLRADLCCNERPKRLPDCIPQNPPLSRKVLAQKNIPQDAFAECFPFDFREIAPEKTDCVFLFDYARRDLSGRAAVAKLPL